MARKAYTPEEVFVTACEIAFLVENGVSQAKIAQEYGVSASAIYQRVKNLDRVLANGAKRGLKWE